MIDAASVTLELVGERLERLNVEFTEAAQQQVESAAAWWLASRPYAPTLFADEFAHALTLLTRGPLLAQVFGDVEGKVVRKVRLPRTRYALYFAVLALQCARARGRSRRASRARPPTCRADPPPIRA